MRRYLFQNKSKVSPRLKYFMLGSDPQEPWCPLLPLALGELAGAALGSLPSQEERGWAVGLTAQLPPGLGPGLRVGHPNIHPAGAAGAWRGLFYKPKAIGSPLHMVTTGYLRGAGEDPLLIIDGVAEARDLTDSLQWTSAGKSVWIKGILWDTLGHTVGHTVTRSFFLLGGGCKCWRRIQRRDREMSGLGHMMWNTESQLKVKKKYGASSTEPLHKLKLGKSDFKNI